MSESLSSTPVLSVDMVTKSYGPVRALQGVSFDVRPGEIVALVGDNGAGKSTLIKILSGVVSPDSGTISVKGQRVFLKGPGAARSAGIETVHQHLALVDEFDVAGNFFLGRELYHGGLLSPLRIRRGREMKRSAMRAVVDLGIRIPGAEHQKVKQMSGGQRQAVAIARAAFWQSSLLLLDEPTAALGVRETAEVLRVVRTLAKGSGLGIVLISHNMAQVAQLCDRAVILQQGRQVAVLDSPLQVDDLVGFITGSRSPQPGMPWVSDGDDGMERSSVLADLTGGAE